MHIRILHSDPKAQDKEYFSEFVGSFCLGGLLAPNMDFSCLAIHISPCMQLVMLRLLAVLRLGKLFQKRTHHVLTLEDREGG